MTWAPFSLVGEMIIRLNGPGVRNRRPSNAGAYVPVATVDDPQEMVELNVTRASLSHSVPPFTAADLEAASRPSSNESANELSGIYLGILNIFACLPQM